MYGGQKILKANRQAYTENSLCMPGWQNFWLARVMIGVLNNAGPR
jgi:hypothetical protein